MSEDIITRDSSEFKELRRNIIRRLETVLRDRYMKEVRITFV